MPEAAEYLAGYGLTQGSKHGNWQISYVYADHIQVKRWWIYEYPVTVVFTYIGTGTPNYDSLLTWFPKFIQQDRIMYTEAGNPWLCTLSQLSSTISGSNVTFKCHGSGYRVAKEPKATGREPGKYYAIDYPTADDLINQYHRSTA